MGALRGLDYPPVIGSRISSMLDHIEYLAERMRLTEITLKSHISGDPELRRLVQYQDGSGSISGSPPTTDYLAT